MSGEQSVGASSLALEAWVNLEGSGKPLKDSGEGRVVVRGWGIRFTRCQCTEVAGAGNGMQAC